MSVLEPLFLGSLICSILQDFGYIVEATLTILQKPSQIGVIHVFREGISQLSG